MRGPIPLPTAKHRYTVIRGPHIDKDSREHFEMRIHKRLIDIVNPNNKTIDSLQRIELPGGRRHRDQDPGELTPHDRSQPVGADMTVRSGRHPPVDVDTREERTCFDSPRR